MKKIERISIKGFQSHFNTDLALAPGVNILIGPSYSGKSAILRAIRWVFRNEPKGDSFINDSFAKSGKVCEVAITFNDGTVVERRKGTGVNQYQILKPGEKPFKADNFGINVPLEVLQAIEMTDAYTWSDIDIDLNFGGQFESAFLLSETARVPALVFGKLIGLDQIDGATKLTGNQKREQQRIVSTAQTEIDTLKTKLSGFPDIAKADALLEKASKTHFEVYMPLVNQGKTLVKLYTDLNEAKGLLDSIGFKFERATTALQLLGVALGKLQVLEERIKTLQSLQIAHTNAESRVKSLSSIIVNPRLQELARVPEMLVSLGAISPRIERLKSIGTAFEGATDDYTETKTTIETRKTTLTTWRKELDDTLGQMDICPFSGGEFFRACKDTLKEGS